MIQRIQLTGKVTRGQLWDTLSYISATAKCIVKVTGSDAFLECIERVITPSGVVGRKTSAGYYDNE